MESMWPDKMIARYARKEWKNEIAYQKKLSIIRLQRLSVKDELRNAKTLPARGSLLTEINALKDLISQVEGIVYPPLA